MLSKVSGTGAGGNGGNGGDVTQQSDTNQIGDHNTGENTRCRPLRALVADDNVTIACVRKASIKC